VQTSCGPPADQAELYGENAVGRQDRRLAGLVPVALTVSGSALMMPPRFAAPVQAPAALTVTRSPTPHLNRCTVHVCLRRLNRNREPTGGTRRANSASALAPR
jgi:hypothetical protein